MKKKIVTLLLVAAMTGTMVVGCGSKADDKTADTKTEQTDDKKDTEEKKELADDEYQYVSAADTVIADGVHVLDVREWENYSKGRVANSVQEGFGLKVVKLGENGITEKDILIHDAHCMDNTLQLKLALMEGPDFPIALGVIRDVEAPTYDDAVHEQIEEVSAKKKYHNFEELLMTNDTWEVK